MPLIRFEYDDLYSLKDLLKAILRALLKEASKEERNPTPTARLEDQFKYAMHSI